MLFFWTIQDKNRIYLLLAGASLSVLFFLKGTFLLLALPIGIEMLLSRRGVKNIILDILVFVAPIILHAGIWLWYFSSRGAIHDFIVASFSFSSKYVKSSWLGHVSSNKTTFVGIMLPIFTVFLIFGIKFLVDLKVGIKKPIYRFLLLWALASFAIGLFAGDFYPYYFLIFIPVFIFILIYWQNIFFLSFRPASRNLEILNQVQDDRSGFWRGLVLAILILSMVISLGMAYKQFYNYFAGSGKAEITEFQQIASYIDQNSNPSDKIVFYSYGATMYHLANRDSGSRFVSASVLLLDEREHYGFNLSDTFISDLQKSQPKFVIMSTDPNDLYYENQKVTDYLRANFVPVKTFNTFAVYKNKND